MPIIEKSLLRLHVEFNCPLPQVATKEEIQEWLEYRLGASAKRWIPVDNPLEDSELKADLGSIEWKAF